jgi:anti-sigma regulatory factor (Ser/Thr protein kinase)
MRGSGFVHEALFYRDADEYVSQLLPFVEEGLDEKEAVLVAVPGYNRDLLRSRLGDHAGHVQFLDMQDMGRNPGKIIPWVLHAFATEHTPRRVRIVGEPIWPGRTPLAYPACVQHEALINLAFAGSEATIVCPYDAQRLEPTAIADAVRTHPILVQYGTRRPSQGYTDPVEVTESLNVALREPIGPVQSRRFDGECLAEVRAFVGAYATEAGLAEHRLADLQLAANEVAINSVTHGGGEGTVRVWSTPDDLICDITDSGHITDPLAGRIPPSPDSEGGRGLALVNFVCDLVRVHTRDGRTTTRLFMTL